MITVNPDFHTHGYVYIPTRAVTAFFRPGQDIEALLGDLAEAGLSEGEVDVFTGNQGLDRFDPMGRGHGLWVRLMRSLEETFSDYAGEFRQAEQILQAGGTVVVVDTAKDEEKKARAGEILKAHHGEDVIYWGPWVIEYL